MNPSPITVSPWPGGKRWVYSITFDEGMSELHQFAVPILAEYGVPGHLEVVVGLIGQVRNLPGSSFNGLHHMGAEELREMIARGWGVGNHTWSHNTIEPDTVELELGRAKQVLEDAVGEPISVYCAANDNSNMSPHVLEGCRHYGYLAAMSLTDDLNRPDDDLLWVNRTFLHTQGYAPFYSAFDPYRNVLNAQRKQGWIIDYCHCPLADALHPNKDCSADELRQRIEAICTEGGDDVWLAKVDDAVDYRYTRRATKIEPIAGREHEFSVSAPGLHPSVRRRVVTLELPPGTWSAEVDNKPAAITSGGGKLRLDVEVSKPRTLCIERVPVSR